MCRIYYLLILFISIFILCGCERQTLVPPSGKAIRIGFIGPFTGPAGAQGRETIKGIRTAIQIQPLLNNGDAIEVIVENDNDDPELTEKVLRKLAHEDNVSAVLLASSSNAALHAASIADSIEIPVIALQATHPEVTKSDGFMNQLCFDDNFQGLVAALFVADELLIEKVTVFTDTEDQHSSYLANEFVRKFKSVDGEITGLVSVNTGQLDYEKILKNAQERGSQALYLPLAEKYVVEIVQAVQEIGWTVDMMGSDGLVASIKNQYSEFLPEMEGLHVTDFYGSRKESRSYTPYARKLAKVFNSLYTGDPSTFTAMGAEAYGILYAALDRCVDPNNRECINRMIRSTDNFDGVMGHISIGPDGKATRPLVVSKINNGEPEIVVSVH